jgi:phosphoribosyl 1,2-cyclic phosphate phosphodiesterase
MPVGFVTLLGTGTSQGVPIIGCSCVVCRSIDSRDKRLRTSAWIRTDTSSVVVDSGPDFRQQALRHGIRSVDGLLLTHEHKDHTGGLDDLRPFNYLLSHEINIYAWPRVLNRIKADYSYAFSKHKYPGIPILNLIDIKTNGVLIGDLHFSIFEVMHHKLPVLAFRCGDFAYITDTNFISEEVLNALTGINTLVLDSLQPEPHLSHFTLDQSIEIAERIGATRTIFTHISHRMGLFIERNNKLPSGIELGYDGIQFTFLY